MKNIILWLNEKAKHWHFTDLDSNLGIYKVIENPREETLKMYSLQQISIYHILTYTCRFFNKNFAHPEIVLSALSLTSKSLNPWSRT